MDERINAGYRIVESHMKPNGDELVIGHHAKAPQPYVCWWCSGGTNYYWGHYYTTYEEARDDMMDRLGFKPAENEKDNLPTSYAEIDYGDRDDAEAVLGSAWDDMNYLHYTER